MGWDGDRSQGDQDEIVVNVLRQFTIIIAELQGRRVVAKSTLHEVTNHCCEISVIYTFPLFNVSIEILRRYRIQIS